MLHRILALSASFLLFGAAASAGPNWHSISLSISLADAPKVQSALAELMSEVGGDLGEGSVSLMANVAGGANSHSIISSFPSRAAREAWLDKLYASDAWQDYAKATDGLTQVVETSRMDNVQNWGEDNEGADVFWELHAFNVMDPAAFVAALGTLQDSEALQANGAQVWLSAVAAAGIAPATHIVAVGFTGEAHAETANAAREASDAWATYQQAVDGVATYEGTWMLRSVQTWGN